MAGKGNTTKRLQTPGVNESVLAQLKAELIGTPAPPHWYCVAQLARLLGVQARTAERFAEGKKFDSARYSYTAPDGRKLLVKHYHIPNL